ncbi:X-domain of DnaJ-containing-domain-containing protein [Dioszegia hungarica]|uniref:X-domain of DnaJ-containing-domain-containing protein n=1 Tax=Dioszegia hungarica TaxID=4972 RepID=A0AA38LTQ7_9TREE|nr:X-domain of DnaJ-containing-domain-containing protein [Dioszegia hungarica]KAI9637107.1 X-domain of DnaJ-containing-domain-containing protein [Dioszegia hungarica]
MSTIVDARPRGSYTPADCPSCSSQQEYLVPPTFIGNLRVRCGQCKTLFVHPQPKPSSSAANAGTSRAGAAGSSTGASGRSGGGGRKIGTDANPIDMAYYDVLGLKADCSVDEIKKAYRRLAIKLHPDKNRDDPDAEEKFKEISIAYQVLSDPALRRKYNEFGQKNGGGGGSEPAGGFQDPEEVFGKMFGGDRFEDWIGTISIGKDMKEAFQQQAEDGDDVTLDAAGKPVMSSDAMQRKLARNRARSERKAQERRVRVEKLAVNLCNKLAVFAEGAKNANDKDIAALFKEKCRLEAIELRDENYGVELLQAIGRAYKSKSDQHQASSQFAPLGWFHGAKSTFNTVSDTMSTLKSAIELKQVFDKLQLAEQSGMAAEDLRKLEEQAAEQGLRTMWKGVKLEVESISRETAEKVLTEPGVPREKLGMRMIALDLLADAFLAVKKDGEIEDFVKVDTPSSKQREAEAGRTSASEKSRYSQQAPNVPPRPAASQPPPTPPRPTRATGTTPDAPLSAEERERLLKEAYKAYEDKRQP